MSATLVRESVRRLDPLERLEALCDPGSVQSLRSRVVSPRLGARAVAGDGVLGATGCVDGRPIVCYAEDGTYLGGSLGERHADTIVRVLQTAARARIPVVGFVESGGARMQEGTAALAERFPTSRAWVGNDATAACWAEHSIGAAAGADEVLLVTLGTGIGGGIVSGGRIVEGAHRYAGEMGHMVIDPKGPPCPCGKRGCWERFASGDALGAFGRDAAAAGDAERVLQLAGGDVAAVRGEHVSRAALAGEPDAIAIMDRFAWWVALGLANLANTLDPELIVIGGGLVTAGEALMGPVRRWFAEMVEAPDARERTRLVLAALGHRSGAIGAGLLAANATGGQGAVR